MNEDRIKSIMALINQYGVMCAEVAVAPDDLASLSPWEKAEDIRRRIEAQLREDR